MKFPKYLTQTTVGKAVSVTPVTLVSISPCFQKILIISFTFNFQHKPRYRQSLQWLHYASMIRHRRSGTTKKVSLSSNIRRHCTKACTFDYIE